MAWNFWTHHLTLMASFGQVFAVFCALLVGAAYLLTRFEKVRFEDALYFAFITAFTVGLGDITPITRAGRVVTVMVAFLGLVIIGLLIAIAGQALERALVAV